MNRLDLLVLMARGYFLRALQRFLGLHGHFFKSQHHRTSTYYLQKGLAFRQPRNARQLAPLTSSGTAYFAPAAAAIAGVPTLTLICFGLASSRFGTVSVSTPF